MAARIAELEDAADHARNRANKLEKDKSRLQIEVRDLTVQLESVRNLPAVTKSSHPDNLYVCCVNVISVQPARSARFSFLVTCPHQHYSR